MQLFMLFLVHAYQGRTLQAGPIPRLYVEGPWHLLWPCLLPWILLEIVLSLMWISNTAPGQNPACDVLYLALLYCNMLRCAVQCGSRCVVSRAASSDVCDSLCKTEPPIIRLDAPQTKCCRSTSHTHECLQTWLPSMQHSLPLARRISPLATCLTVEPVSGLGSTLT